MNARVSMPDFLMNKTNKDKWKKIVNKEIEAIDIIRIFLSENGYDGLCNLGHECGCEIDDLVPCSSDFSFCRPGYKVEPTEEQREDGAEWAIALEKDKP